MTSQSIVDYITKELARGVNESEIKRVLIGVGWSEHDITENIARAKGHTPEPIVRQPVVPANVIHQETHAELAQETYHEPQEKIGFLKKRTKLVVALVVAFLLLGGGAYVVYAYVFPPPAKILLQAQTNLQDVKSFDYSGKLTVNVSTEGDLFSMGTWSSYLNPNSDKRIAGANNVQFGIDFSGSADMTDQLHPKNDLIVNINASIITFGFNLRLINDVVYIKVDQIPEIAQDAAQYAGVWMKVDPEKIAKETGIAIDLQNGQPDLTDGQKQQLEDLAANTRFFSGATKLANDSIDGAEMYHYALAIDKAGMKNYFLQVNQIITQAGGFTDQITQIFDSMEFNNVEVWVGKSDKMIYRISGIISQKTESGTIPAAGSLNFLLNFKNFNNSGKIEAPNDSKDIFEVIEEYTVKAEVKARDAERFAEVRQLMTALELYYNDFGRYPRKLDDLKGVYMAASPIAPTPIDGTCTEQQNTYTYTQKSSGQDYALTFCVGSGGISGFESGLHTAGPTGLE